MSRECRAGVFAIIRERTEGLSSPALQSREVGYAWDRLGVDGRLDRHAGAQQAGEARVVQNDLHRDALNDLVEVAGRVVRRQQGECEPAGRRQAVDMTSHLDARETVDLDRDRLAVPDT